MSAASAFACAGADVPLFGEARNWQSYWRREIAQYIHGDVLEVGAGRGANTRALADLQFDSWTALEPDAALAARIELPSRRHRKEIGTLADITGWFDTILYIDVLEHIAADRMELARAAAHLNEGGALIVLSPAHGFLYTPFDAAIGHVRRYTRKSLRAIAPRGLEEVRINYLDCAGMLASAAHRLVLRSALPSERQIRFYDQLMVPASRAIDPLLGWRVGKSVLAIWRHQA